METIPEAEVLAQYYAPYKPQPKPDNYEYFDVQQSPQQPAQELSRPEQIGQLLLGAGAKALSKAPGYILPFGGDLLNLPLQLGNTLTDILNYIPGVNLPPFAENPEFPSQSVGLPTSKDYEQFLKEQAARVVPEKYTQKSPYWSEKIQNVLGSLPEYALMGVSPKEALVRSAGGEALSEGARRFGFGPAGQALAYMAGSRLASKPGMLRGTGQTVKEEVQTVNRKLWNKGDQLIKQIGDKTVAVPEIEQTIKEVADEMAQGSKDAAMQKRVMKTLNDFERSIKNGQMSGKNLDAFKKDMNHKIYNHEYSPQERAMYSRLRESARTGQYRLSDTYNPKLKPILDERDKLHQIMLDIDEKELDPFNEMLRTVRHPIKTIGKSAPVQRAKLYKQSNAMRDYYNEMNKQAALENMPAAFTNYTKLMNAAKDIPKADTDVYEYFDVG